MMYRSRQFGWVLGVVAIGLCVSVVTAAQVTQNFGSAPDGWVAVLDGGAAGSTLGWASSNLANGVAGGEAGGTIVENPTFEYYADITNIADPLDEGDDIFASGRLFVGNISDEGTSPVSDESFLGHFDRTASDIRDGGLGLSIKDEDSDTMRFRLEARKGGSKQYSGGAQDTLYFAEDSVFDWAYSYESSTSELSCTVTLISGSFEGNDGDGNGVISDDTWTNSFAVTEFDVDSFGLGSRTRNSDGPDFYNDVFIDDVTYTVPEPATMAVLALGGLVAVRRRRA